MVMALPARDFSRRRFQLTTRLLPTNFRFRLSARLERLMTAGRASTRTVKLNGATGAREIEIEPHPNVLQWGFALEYSIIYLEEQVKDIGLRAPFDRLIPLVEVPLETPLDRGQGGQTTGTINPGL